MPDGGAALNGSDPLEIETFCPSPETARAYRTALGSFGTGVTIVTCMDASAPLAMTANSFSSVSLDPPLVLWSPAITSSRHDAFVAAKHFSIHVLSKAQLKLAFAFAKDGRDFSHVAWEAGENGAPALPGSVTRFDCVHHAAHGAGDHTIVLGRVERACHTPSAPLLFWGGAYGTFAERDFTTGG
ncbi:MAG: flavin reductase family protein [Pseudomonadota bacterium]